MNHTRQPILPTPVSKPTSLTTAPRPPSPQSQDLNNLQTQSPTVTTPNSPNPHLHSLREFWSLRLASNSTIINPLARSQVQVPHRASLKDLRVPPTASLRDLRPILDTLGFTAESVLAETLRCSSVQRTLAAIDEINGRFKGWVYGGEEEGDGNGEKGKGGGALHGLYLGMSLISNHAKRERANALVVRMLNVMEGPVQALRAMFEQNVNHVRVQWIALKFITELDHYMASLVTWMDKGVFPENVVGV